MAAILKEPGEVSTHFDALNRSYLKKPTLSVGTGETPFIASTQNILNIQVTTN